LAPPGTAVPHVPWKGRRLVPPVGCDFFLRRLGIVRILGQFARQPIIGRHFCILRKLLAERLTHAGQGLDEWFRSPLAKTERLRAVQHLSQPFINLHDSSHKLHSPPGYLSVVAREILMARADVSTSSTSLDVQVFVHYCDACHTGGDASAL